MMPISMNLSSERKHNMKSIFAIVSLALAVVSPAFAGIEWGFDTATSFGASGGSGTAAITLGTFGHPGWHSGTVVPWTSYAGATGFWDLGGQSGVTGHPGSIVLSGMTLNSPTTTLKVFEWVNAGTYSGVLTYSLNDLLPTSVTLIGSPGQASWWQYDVTFAQGLTPGDKITILAPTTGAIIDRLTLVPEPATLIAGAILLIPFALSTWPILRRRKTS
jgi:hypothetical protein